MSVTLFVFAAVLTTLIYSLMQGRISLPGLLLLFALIFIAGIAAAFLILPFGPMLWGVALIPVFVIMMIVALFFPILITIKGDKDGKGRSPMMKFIVATFSRLLFVSSLIMVFAEYYLRRIIYF